MKSRFFERHNTLMMCLIVIGTASLMFFITVLLISSVNYIICRNTGLMLGIDHKWILWGGCYYKIDGIWIPADMLDYIKLLGEIK